ncbi:uncharacterized protein [Gorilla gorilla gorilla]|uniref:uncharacterized protein isoform X1 n=1 Tax=Gorilla gorilla gorilla TaxID=9595 RepID=UPI00300ACF31
MLAPRCLSDLTASPGIRVSASERQGHHEDTPLTCASGFQPPPPPTNKEGKVLRVTAPGSAAAVRQPAAAADSFGGHAGCIRHAGTPLKPAACRARSHTGDPGDAGASVALENQAAEPRRGQTGNWRLRGRTAGACSPLVTLYSGKGEPRPPNSSSGALRGVARAGREWGGAQRACAMERRVAWREGAWRQWAWRSAKRRGAHAREGCRGPRHVCPCEIKASMGAFLPNQASWWKI